MYEKQRAFHLKKMPTKRRHLPAKNYSEPTFVSLSMAEPMLCLPISSRVLIFVCIGFVCGNPGPRERAGMRPAMFCITELCSRYSVLLWRSCFFELHFVQYKERRDQKRRAGGEADPGRFGESHDEIAHGADRRNQRRVGQLRLHMADVLAGCAGGGEDRRVGNFRAGFRPAFFFRRARSRPDDRRRAGRRFAGP